MVTVKQTNTRTKDDLNANTHERKLMLIFYHQSVADYWLKSVNKSLEYLGKFAHLWMTTYQSCVKLIT
jgi:hypothetical protein